MSDKNKKLDSAQWTKYWQKGTLTTFLGEFKHNYSGPIKEFWYNFFSNIPDSSKIIDLATGNGALAILASEYNENNNKNYSIIGIDFATIDPSNIAHQKISKQLLSNIRFASKTRIEDTNLDSNLFDVAISQFGFEYSDIEKSIIELDRILKASAKLAFFIHYSESDIIKQARNGLEQNDYCLSSNLHELILGLLKAKDTQDDALSLEDKRNKINEETQRLHDISEKYKDKTQLAFFLQNSMSVFGKKFSNHSIEQKISAMEYVKEECVAFDQRMSDLVLAARTKDQISDITKMLADIGFKLEQSKEFYYRDSCFGYTLIASR